MATRYLLKSFIVDLGKVPICVTIDIVDLTSHLAFPNSPHIIAFAGKSYTLLALAPILTHLWLWTLQAGLALNTLKSFNELYDVKTVAALFVIGLVSIVPAIVSRSQSQAPDRPHSS